MRTIRRVFVTMPVVAFLATSLTWVVGTTAAGAAPATVLVNEPFTGATVSDPLIRGTGATCLTGATTSTAQLAACPTSQSGPVPPRGVTPGYLQLTDAANSKAGAVFYNRPIPASVGIDANVRDVPVRRHRCRRHHVLPRRRRDATHRDGWTRRQPRLRATEQ